MGLGVVFAEWHLGLLGGDGFVDRRQRVLARQQNGDGVICSVWPFVGGCAS